MGDRPRSFLGCACRTKCAKKDSCLSVGMVYYPKGLPGVSTAGPGVDRVLHHYRSIFRQPPSQGPTLADNPQMHSYPRKSPYSPTNPAVSNPLELVPCKRPHLTFCLVHSVRPPCSPLLGLQNPDLSLSPESPRTCPSRHLWRTTAHPSLTLLPPPSPLCLTTRTPPHHGAPPLLLPHSIPAARTSPMLYPQENQKVLA
jgi:hypothetical protein